MKDLGRNANIIRCFHVTRQRRLRDRRSYWELRWINFHFRRIQTEAETYPVNFSLNTHPFLSSWGHQIHFPFFPHISNINNTQSRQLSFGRRSLAKPLKRAPIYTQCKCPTCRHFDSRVIHTGRLRCACGSPNMAPFPLHNGCYISVGGCYLRQ